MKTLEEYLKKNNKTDIIFDFDATIIELLIPWQHIFDGIREDLRSMDTDIIQEYDNGVIGDVMAQNKYLKKYGARARSLLHEHLAEFESNNLKGLRVNYDLVDFIKKDSSYKKYIWSSNSLRVLEPVMKEHKIWDRFEKVVSRDVVDILKPYPNGFELIHDKKTPIEAFLFVGDSTNDEGAAKALGMDFFKVSF